jgi:hypothetical protein
MNILLEFYKNCLRYTTIGIGFLSAWVSTSMPDIVSKIVVSGVTLGILFMIAEWTIRNKIWRCCFLYRYLDFEDEWRCVTFYQEIESRDQSIINSFTPYHVYHEAKIDQDCRNIRISPSFGKVYNKWESIIMDLTASRGIAYAYAVEYTDGYKAKGYEELSVMQRFPIKNGKPILLEVHLLTAQRDSREYCEVEPFFAVQKCLTKSRYKKQCQNTSKNL